MRFIGNRLLCISLLLFVWGCHTTEKQTESVVVETIGEEGGAVTNEGAKLEVPAGALPENVEISLEVSDEEAPETYTAYSNIYVFGPDGLTFEVPVTVTLEFEGSFQDAVVYWSRPDGHGFDNLGGIVQGQSIQVQVTHFSSGFVGSATTACGDGEVQDGEDCDGANLNGQTCESLGYFGGELSCDSSCHLDTTQCNASAACGNGVLDAGEDCDGANMNGQTCQTLGYYGGTLTCSANCEFELTGCSASGFCGDDAVQAAFGEDCDGANLNGETCLSLGYVSGVLACADCQRDVSGCVLSVDCGNGVVDGGEQCEGSDLNGATCQTLGHLGGTLGCHLNCSYDETACIDVENCENGRDDDGDTLVDCLDADCTGDPACTFGEICGNGIDDDGDGQVDCLDAECAGDPFCLSGDCGNGVIDTGEDCDGANLNGQTCLTLGYVSGVLACADCQRDVSGCVLSLDCGNGVVDGGEQCEGSDLNGATCQTLGHLGGTLVCHSNCSYDESACIDVENCENGRDDDGDTLVDCLDADCTGDPACTFGEVCGNGLDDDGDGQMDCLDAECVGDPFCLSGDCGNGVIDAGEDCDGADMNGQTCETFGYYGGVLACSGACEWELTSCVATGFCGDGAVQAAYGELCDTTNMNGQTCLTLGYVGGILSCEPTCLFGTALCTL